MIRIEGVLGNPIGDVEHESGSEVVSAWRHRLVIGVAIALWLLTWLAGWWLSAKLAPDSTLFWVIGTVVSWSIGLGMATLILYLDERL